MTSSSVATGASAKTIVVVAPATLEEDFTFDVTLGGRFGDRPYTVTVPPGGIRKGEEFEIPYPDHSSDVDQSYISEEEESRISSRVAGGVDGKGTSSSSKEEEDDDDEKTSDTITGAPYGRWRNHVCSCCDVVTQATFWMSFVCSPILIAQLVTRLGLTYKGKPAPGSASPSWQTAFGEAQEERSLSYNKIILSFVTVLFVSNFLPIAGIVVVLAYMFLLLLFVGSNIRRTMRLRYKIPTYMGGPESRTARVEDCACMAFCGCCSIIQMARHTHNDKEYPGYCCTTTGLEAGAPKIVV